MILVVILAGATSYFGYRALIPPTPTPQLSGEVELSSLTITPTTAIEGEPVTVSVNATNVGEANVTGTIILELNGVTETSKSVTLAGGETKKIEFNVTKGPGEYDVAVHGLTGTFTVRMAIKNPDAIVTTVYGPPSTLDPASAYDGIVQIINVYETLIYFDREHIDRFVPVLATEVPSVENGLISSDGLTYIFPIRTGVEFSNGNPLTPEDVEYSFERMMVCDPDGGPVWMLLSPLLGCYCTRNGEIAVTAEEIDNAVESNATHVIFHLKKPFPMFLQVLSLSTGIIFDREWSIEQGCWSGTWDNWQEYNNPEILPLDTKMMGTGPYKFVRWERTVELVLTRNENYWGEPAKVKRVHWKFIEEWSTEKMMFLRGDLDIIETTPAHYKDLEGVEGIVAFKDLEALAIHTMVFNWKISPESEYIGSGKLDGEGIPTDFFTDKNVRLGFAYSFPYDDFIQEALVGEGKRIATCMPGNIPFYNPEQEKFSLDLTKAEEYFRQAWDGQVWDKGFRFTIQYPIGDEITRIMVEMLVDNLRKVNPKFQISLLGMEETAYWAEAEGMDPCPNPMSTQARWWADFADADNFFETYMSSYGYYPWNMYCATPHTDELVAKGAGTLDPGVRRDVYYELQQIYHDEAYGIPVYQMVERIYMRDWVQGWYFRPLWWDTTHYDYLEKGY